MARRLPKVGSTVVEVNQPRPDSLEAFLSILSLGDLQRCLEAASEAPDDARSDSPADQATTDHR